MAATILSDMFHKTKTYILKIYFPICKSSFRPNRIQPYQYWRIPSLLLRIFAESYRNINIYTKV